MPPLPTVSGDTRRLVLVIEDDEDIAEAIAFHLAKAGMRVQVELTGEGGIAAARRGADIIVLDLNLPDMDGLEVCRLIRRADEQAPIIIVSARAEEMDRVLGLELGADDYMVKPCSLKDLAARCRAALRRANTRRIDAYVRRLRQKLGDGRERVETVVGVDYRFLSRGEERE